MNNEIYLDAFNLLAGKLLGEGIHRKVFECKVRPDLVVKVEEDDYRWFANVMEQHFYWDPSEALRDWCRCHMRLPSGHRIYRYLT